MSKNNKNKGFIQAVSCSLILFFLVLFCRQPGFAQGKGEPVWRYKPEKIKVDDSFSFIYHRDRTSSITVLKLFVKGGKNAEPKEQKGLAYVTSVLCTSLSEHLDRKRRLMLGSTFYAVVKEDYCVITIETLSEYLDVTLGLLLKSIKKPIFSHSRIKNIKKSLEYFQKEEMDEPYHRMKIHFADIFFPGTPYSGSHYGTSDSLKNISPKAVKKFYKKYFQSSNIVMSVSSDLPHFQITKMMKKHFSGFLNRKKKETAMVPAVKSGTGLKKEEAFFYKDSKQTLVSMGAKLPALSPLNYAKGYLLEDLLGGGSGSRLWPLRSEKKLAYSLGALVKHMKHGGILHMFLKTDRSKQDRALASLRAVLSELYQKGVSPEEFMETKARCRVAFLSDNEKKGNRVFDLGAYECLGLGYFMLEEFFTYLDQLTLEEFNRYIKEVLNPEKLAVVVIGRE